VTVGSIEPEEVLTVRTVLPSVATVIVLASPVWGGVNRDGAMVVHTNDTYAYTVDTRCSTPYVQNLNGCDDVITRTDRTPAVVWLLAVFQDVSQPAVSGLRCAITYGPNVVVEDYWICPGDALEIPDADWPGPDSHDSILFTNPIVGDRIFPFYGFLVSNDGGGVDEFCTVTDWDTYFADTSMPPIEDPCTRNGCVRWYQAGYADCNPSGQPGACCFQDLCFVLMEPECNNQGGLFVPDWTCEPSPCTTLDVPETDVTHPAIVFGPAVPNPSRGIIDCVITLPGPASVRVQLFDPGGRRVRSLMDQEIAAGAHSFTWRTWDPGGAIPSGVYSIRFEAVPLARNGGDFRGGRASTRVQRIVLLR